MSVDSKVFFMAAGCTASDIDNSTGFRLLSIDDKHVTSTFPSNVSVTVPAYSYPSPFHDGPPSLPMVQGLQVNSIGHCLYYDDSPSLRACRAHACADVSDNASVRRINADARAHAGEDDSSPLRTHALAYANEDNRATCPQRNTGTQVQK